jgi:DNA-binding MarR family transcriptional regulator
MTASALVRLEADAGIRVTLPEYRVLVLLTNGPRRPSELADDLEVTRAAIAQILRRLDATKMISRRTDRDDRRSAKISLTANGDRIVTTVLAERERRLRPALRELGARDRHALGTALERLRASLTRRPTPAASTRSGL